jgi:hypothetical protein
MFIPVWVLLLLGFFLLWLQHHHREEIIRVNNEAYDRGEEAGKYWAEKDKHFN